MAALLSIIVWGTTFISTKLLLSDFQPIEVLFFRFVLGLIALYVAYPHSLKGTTSKQELTFVAAGFFGICLYYLFENIALTYTMASNVGVIISVAPFFTAIISHVVTKEEKLRLSFFVGFFVAMLGIALISFNGAELSLNPFGDILALLAALVWACYSVLMKKIGGFGYNSILTTRRVFLYGIILMLPFLYFFDFNWDLTRFVKPVNLFNITFLGLGASAICFVTWTYALEILGAVKTSIYIYGVPVIAVITSVIVLHEEITLYSGAGIFLTIMGLFLSERGFFDKRSGKR